MGIPVFPQPNDPFDLDFGNRDAYGTNTEIVDALISPKPQGILPSYVFGGGYKIHVFWCAAWRNSAKNFFATELTVVRAIPNLVPPDIRFPAFSMHRFRGYVAESGKKAIAVEYIEPLPMSLPFSRVVEELENPKTLSHPVLGEMRFNAVDREISSNPVWNGREISLSIAAKNADFGSPLVNSAVELWKQDSVWNERLQEFVMKQCSEELANGSNARTESLRLHFIRVDDIGVYQFWFSDGGLFGGHSLVVRVRPESKEWTFSVEG